MGELVNYLPRPPDGVVIAIFVRFEAYRRECLVRDDAVIVDDDGKFL